MPLLLMSNRALSAILSRAEEKSIYSETQTTRAQGIHFKSDERILGDSDFVESVLKEQETDSFAMIRFADSRESKTADASSTSGLFGTSYGAETPGSPPLSRPVFFFF